MIWCCLGTEFTLSFFFLITGVTLTHRSLNLHESSTGPVGFRILILQLMALHDHFILLSLGQGELVTCGTFRSSFKENPQVLFILSWGFLLSEPE